MMQPQAPKPEPIRECENAADEVLKAGAEYRLSRSGKHRLSRSGKIVREILTKPEARANEDERDTEGTA